MKKFLLMMALVFVGLVTEGQAEFPVEEAGLAAWVKVGSLDSHDAIKGFTRRVPEQTGDGFVIGIVSVPNWLVATDVNVYVNDAGYLVAYVKRGESARAMLFGDDVEVTVERSGANIRNPIVRVTIPNNHTTTLARALETVGDVLGVSTRDAKYAHFQYPDASYFTSLGSIVGQGQKTASIFVPNNVQVASLEWGHVSTNRTASIEFNGDKLSSNVSGAKFGRYGISQLALGTSHTLKITSTVSAFDLTFGNVRPAGMSVALVLKGTQANQAVMSGDLSFSAELEMPVGFVEEVISPEPEAPTMLLVDLDPAPMNQGQNTMNGFGMGDSLTVQLYVKDMPPVSGWGVVANFDGDGLEFVEFVEGNFISNADVVVREAEGMLDIGGASLSGAAAQGDGWLGDIKFQVRSSFKDSTTVAITRLGLLDIESGLEEMVLKDVSVTVYEMGDDVIGDFNGDGKVTFSDFLLFAKAFSSPTFDAKFDLDGDGRLGFTDFLVFSQNFK